MNEETELNPETRSTSNANFEYKYHAKGKRPIKFFLYEIVFKNNPLFEKATLRFKGDGFISSDEIKKLITGFERFIKNKEYQKYKSSLIQNHVVNPREEWMPKNAFMSITLKKDVANRIGNIAKIRKTKATLSQLNKIGVDVAQGAQLPFVYGTDSIEIDNKSVSGRSMSQKTVWAKTIPKKDSDAPAFKETHEQVPAGTEIMPGITTKVPGYKITYLIGTN
jgi:hypothetical protein